METRKKQEILPEENSQEVSPQLTDIANDMADGRPKGYCHDSKVDLNNPAWMRAMKETIHLHELSLPGTHDSMSFYGGDSVQCQSMSLNTQLRSGIRVLDIRCRHISNIFAIHHGVVYQNANFNDVLNTVIRFLQENPSETVYMRVQKEHTEENVTRTFEETFRDSYWKSYKSFFWQPSTSKYPLNPPLSETRGRIVLFQNFTATQTYGIKWGKFSIQDAYSMSTNWDLYSKWEKVKSHLKKANESKDETKFINFLSGSGGSFPYFVASGQSSHQTNAPRLLTGLTTPGWKNSYPDFPRIGCFLGICSIAFEGTNILAADRIGKGSKFSNKTGIVMADFPGADLISRIIELN